MTKPFPSSAPSVKSFYLNEGFTLEEISTFNQEIADLNYISKPTQEEHPMSLTQSTKEDLIEQIARAIRDARAVSDKHSFNINQRIGEFVTTLRRIRSTYTAELTTVRIWKDIGVLDNYWKCNTDLPEIIEEATHRVENWNFKIDDELLLMDAEVRVLKNKVDDMDRYLEKSVQILYDLREVLKPIQN